MTSARREQLETELAKVRGELENLENALRDTIEAEQHEVIEDDLEDYFAAVENRFSGLRIFLRELW